ncbi:MAG: 50S ribosomal protein L32e [Candidatus Diapherotrites archaeon]|nr:50S ribosomal protein L32e [Candidatus Diapherotrites archaeon]
MNKETKKPAKKEAKTVQKKEAKPAVKKQKTIKAKSTAKKSIETKKIQLKLKKKSKPVFRGRFGKRGSARSIKKDKWNKWRVPRGIDVVLNKDSGKIPSIGFRTPKKFRGLHPSGYKEIIVRNVKELEAIKEGFAAKIYSNTGKKKRKEITKKAQEKGIIVLNR